MASAEAASLRHAMAASPDKHPPPKVAHQKHNVKHTSHSKSISKNNTDKYPTLLRISEAEAEAITSCFRLYDYYASGRISKVSTKKLVKSLGFQVSVNRLSSEVSLHEFLLFLDQCLCDPEPALECSLVTWSELAGRKVKSLSDGSETLMISAQDMADFMVSLGRPPISLSEANCLLTSLLEYDDCSESPQIPMEAFKKQLCLFSRKNNILKDHKN